MNPSMPYILAVHKYGCVSLSFFFFAIFFFFFVELTNSGHEALQAYRFDFANFEIPNAGDEPADYIVWVQ